VVLAAVYLLYMFQRIFYGPVSLAVNRRLKDLKPWEVGLAGVLAAVSIWGGIYPSSFLKPMEASVQATRLMATGAQGHRPVWSDLSQSIVMSENAPNRGSLIATGSSESVTPAELHYQLPIIQVRTSTSQLQDPASRTP
jgi:NADH-quinone oxidoreductase subunit M